MSLSLMLPVLGMVLFVLETLSSSLSLKYQVLEEVKIGTSIGFVLHDAKLDREVSGISNCQLFDMDSRKQSGEIIQVKATTCELFVHSRIDREQLCDGLNCILQMSVFIDAKIWVAITIEVIDINDNRPKFDPSSITVRFEENSPIGNFITLPLASDADIGVNSVHSYSLEFPLHFFELVYTAHTNLRLIVLGKLDYEQKSDRQFSTKLVACDQGSNQLCGKLNINIQIIDINDNRPIFFKCNESVNVMEDCQVGEEVYQVLAKDLDDGENGRITYEISHVPANKLALQYFSVNKVTGKIFLSKSLHSVGIPEKISLIITASDHGSLPLLTECKLNFNIYDVNNHAPHVTVKPTLGKFFQITENNAEITTVGLIIVTDGDKNDNGKVSCELKNTSSVIILERWSIDTFTYKLLVTKPVDREIVPFINVSIICRDYGTPVRMTEKHLSISIIDVNEFSPVLVVNPVQITIPENLSLNFTIATIQASDKDADANLTVKLRSDHDGSFGISSNGELILTKAVDRETRSLYHLVAMALDNSPPVYRTTTLTLTISISDVNDNAPRLLEPRSFHLLENLVGSSSKIGQLKTFDPDLGLNGSVKFTLLSAYSLDDKFVNNSFSITENDGIIFSLLPIDREVTPEITLRILLKDQGIPSLSKEEIVHLTIADENDNKPLWQFPSPDNCNLNLSVAPTSSRYNERYSLITIVRVSDPDSSENANITFKLLSATKEKLPTHIFSLESSTGHLMGIGIISEGLYVLKMQASDNGRPPLLSDVASLYITAHSSNRGYGNDTDRLSLTLIIALASVTCIICVSLLVAIIVVRQHRYSSIQFSSNGQTNDHNSLVNDSLNKWTEEQNQYLDSWTYSPHYCSYPVIPGMQKLSSIGEPLLPPPGPKDVLSNMNNQQHLYPIMHLRRPPNQDIDVSSADSGRGASEEENMLSEGKNRDSIRPRGKMCSIMPPISSVCACQDSLSMCGSCANSMTGELHYQYVTYSPTSYQTLDDTRNTIQFHTSRPNIESSTKNYHTLNTMVTATSLGSHTDVVPTDTTVPQHFLKDMSSFLGPHSNV